MKEELKYKILFLIRYFGDAMFYPFLSLYLKSVGLIENEVGLIISLTPILSIIAYPIYARLCTDLKKTKTILTIIGAIEGIIILIIGFSQNRNILLILSILLSIFGTSHYGLLDSLSTVYCKKNGKSYSLIRMFGSIAYAISTTCAGFFAERFGYTFCFVICCIFFILASVIYLLIKPISDDSKKEKANLNTLLNNKGFIILVLFYVLLNGTAFSSDHFLSLYLQERGLTESDYGIIFSCLVVVEVLTIFILNKIYRKNKANPSTLLLISASCFTIRIFAYYINAPVPLLIGATMLRGITYGIILYVLNPLVVDVVGEKNSILAIIVMNMSYCLFQGICDNVFGNIISLYSYNKFYLIVLVISIIPLIITLYCLNFMQSAKKINKL